MTPHTSDLVVDARGVARFQGRRFVCSVGPGGFRSHKREGDGAGASGRFRIVAVYWRPDRVAPPPGRLSSIGHPLRRWDGWSDDPARDDYNTLVRPYPARGAERLWRSDRLYDRIVVTSANADPVVKGAGSALFVHVWRSPRRPTAGCVAFSPSDLDWILARWTTRSRIVLRAGRALRA